MNLNAIYCDFSPIICRLKLSICRKILFKSDLPPNNALMINKVEQMSDLALASGERGCFEKEKRDFNFLKSLCILVGRE